MYMELFKPTGQKTWQMRFTDHRGLRRQLSMRTRNRVDAICISGKIEQIVGAMMRQDALKPELLQWVQACHVSIKEKLLAWELLSLKVAEGGRRVVNPPDPKPLPAGWIMPPPSMVELWRESLKGDERARKYYEKQFGKVQWLLTMAVPGHPPIHRFEDITPAAIDARVKALRKGPPSSVNVGKIGGRRRACTPQTCNDYLVALKQFCEWVVGQGWAPTNPLKAMDGFTAEQVRAARNHLRRSLTLEEQVLLVSGTATLPARWNMTGEQRATLYRFAINTGLRADECHRLKVRNLNLFTKRIILLAQDTKAKRQEELPLHPDLIEPLRKMCEGKHPEAEVFPKVYAGNYCRMLREDLAELGIEYTDALGRHADFHSLRHTFGTELAKVVMPAVHMRLMRHSDIKTTMNFYVHTELADQANGLAKLPSLTPAANAGSLAS